MTPPCRSFAIDFARSQSCCLCSALSRYFGNIVPCRMRSSPAAEMQSARAEKTLRQWFHARCAGNTGTSTSERAASGSARYSRKNSLSLTALSVARSRLGACHLFKDSPSFSTTRTCAISNATGAAAATTSSSADVGSNCGYSR